MHDSLHDPADDHVQIPRAGSRALARVGLALAALVVALVVVGQALFLTHALGSGSWNTSLGPTKGTVAQRIDVVLRGALGVSDRGAKRFYVVRAAPDRASPRLIDLVVRWAINDDVSSGTIGNGAESDAYVLLRDLYTARLPLGQVQLVGTYSVRDAHGQQHESPVMKLFMSSKTASIIGHTGWENFDPTNLWPLVGKSFVDPQFQPQAPE